MNRVQTPAILYILMYICKKKQKNNNIVIKIKTSSFD